MNLKKAKALRKEAGEITDRHRFSRKTLYGRRPNGQIICVKCERAIYKILKKINRRRQ